MAFSPDDTRVLTGAFDKTARLWDGQTGAPLGEPMRHEGIVSDLAFSPDGTRVVTGSLDKTARLWDGKTGAPLGKPMRHEETNFDVAFSPDGTRVLTGSSDETARLWDGKTGAPLGEPMSHESGVTSVAFSPDGTRVLTGSGALGTRCEARLWDGWTGAPLGEPMSHENGYTSVAFSPDGTRVVTGSWDKTARLWDVTVLKLPEEFAIRLAEYQTGKTLIDQGQFRLLSQEELRQRLSGKTEWLNKIADIVDRRSAETRRQILRDAEERKDWFAVVFHLRQLCRLHPEDADLQTRLHVSQAHLAEQRPLAPEFAPEMP